MTAALPSSRIALVLTRRTTSSAHTEIRENAVQTRVQDQSTNDIANNNSRCLREGERCKNLSTGFRQADQLFYRRGGASGNKLKMTLGLPVYAPPSHLEALASSCRHLYNSKLIVLSQWCCHELLRQLRRTKSLHHLSQRNRRSSQSFARCRCWRHGDGYSQEGQA